MPPQVEMNFLAERKLPQDLRFRVRAFSQPTSLLHVLAVRE